MIELFDRRFVHFMWDDELEGKTGHVSNDIKCLCDYVNNNPSAVELIEHSSDESQPFQTTDGIKFRFFYYDPNYEVKKAFNEGKWVKRWEPWRYVKDELPKIEVGYKVAVEVCYLNAYGNSCKMECDWNGKDFIYQHFDGKKWIFDKKVSLLGKVFAWRYKVDDWPTPPKEE